MLRPSLLVGLTLLASLSPLLSFIAMFQQKEWRVHRLRAHLQDHGAFLQLFGRVMPGILLLSLLIPFVLPLQDTLRRHLPYEETKDLWLVTTLGLLAAFSVGNIVLQHQRYPVGTAKASLMVIGGFCLMVGISLLLVMTPGAETVLPFLPLLQPFIVGLAFLFLLPLDRAMKRSVFDRARAARRKRTDLLVIGITGSAGKTTTKELLGHLLQDLHPLVTPERVNSELGVAQWMTRMLAKRGQEPFSEKKAPGPFLLIAEMGAYRKGEIALLCDILKPQLGIVTLIGPQHVALFGSEEATATAKGELFEALPPDGHAFLNGDSPYADQLKAKCRCPVTIVSSNRASEALPAGITNLPLQGTHNTTNVLLAVACAKQLGIGDARIAELLATFRGMPETFHVEQHAGVTVLHDTYNSSVMSVSAAIAWAAAQPQAPKTLLMSDLLETGKHRGRFLESLGRQAAPVFDRVIFLNKKCVRYFRLGYKKDVGVLRRRIPKVSPGSLLVCCGRMPASVIEKLLPP